jgi:hypothetical protein
MRHHKNRVQIKIIVLLLAFATVNYGIVSGAGPNRIYPTQRVTLYEGDKKVGVYTKEMPFPEGVTVSPTGRCSASLGDLFIVGEDQSVFSSNTAGRHRNLIVKKGIIYFKLSTLRQPFTLLTPDGALTVQSVRLNASYYDRSLKGYVAVDKGKSELGVVEGGSMDVVTEDGPVAIKSGENIILSQADMDIGPPAEEEKPAEEEAQPAKKGLTGKQIAFATLGALAAIGLIFAVGGGGGGGGGGGSVSPSSP